MQSFIVSKYPKISLSEERLLIQRAQKGSKKATEEIVLRHTGFILFRLHKRAFPGYLRRFGEDLLSEAVFSLYEKIKTYDLAYCDSRGNPRPVKFSSYVWKRIDGFILDSLKKEIEREQKEGCKTRIRDAEIRDAISDFLDNVEEIPVSYI